MLRRSIIDQLPQHPVSLVSGFPEYLSGEANVTVKGNENPIIRLGLGTSGVTLVEFPAADRFFALHPGNSEMVTIDESPTRQNDTSSSSEQEVTLVHRVLRALLRFPLLPSSPKCARGRSSVWQDQFGQLARSQRASHVNRFGRFVVSALEQFIAQHINLSLKLRVC